MPGKREGCLSWPEYFMEMAKLNAKRSKDPSTQVGASIISNDNRILSNGYNGLTKGMDDNEFHWLSPGEATDNYLETKNPFVAHAELNAILNALGDSKSLIGSTIYVTLFPCNECTKAIIQSGITKIVYLKLYNKPEPNEKAKVSLKASIKMLDAAGVEYIEYSKLLEQSKEQEYQKMLKKQ